MRRARRTKYMTGNANERQMVRQNTTKTEADEPVVSLERSRVRTTKAFKVVEERRKKKQVQQDERETQQQHIEQWQQVAAGKNAAYGRVRSKCASKMNAVYGGNGELPSLMECALFVVANHVAPLSCFCVGGSFT